MSNHTRGPWEVSFGTDVYFRGQDLHVAGCNMDPDISEDECRANARLVSAAPEILEVLKQAVSVHGYDSRCGWIEDAKAAISKAEGRT